MTDEGLRSLAAAVLRQAVEEAHGAPRAGCNPKVGRRALQREALAFLDPEDPDVRFWCACLDWDPETFCEAARQNGSVLLTPAGRRSARRALDAETSA